MSGVTSRRFQRRQVAAPVLEAPQWNPRFLAYCVEKGASTPGEMIERDRANWPGGHMAGFLCWIGDRWAEWHKAFDRDVRSDRILDVHEHFDNWLANRMIDLTRDRRPKE